MAILLLLLTSHLLAQQGTASGKDVHPVWQRKVVRTITLYDTGVAGEQMKLLERQDKLFSKLLIRRAEKNTITAFPSLLLDTPLPHAQIMDMVTIPPTITITDSGGPAYQVLIMTPNDFNYKIRSYKILEEWSYDTHSGKTAIRIAAIAPVQDIYGEDGTYRGSKAMFWVKWAAISDLVNSCGKYDTVNDIARLIWEDYFEDEHMKKKYMRDENHRTKTGWKKTAIQSTAIGPWYPFGIHANCDLYYEVNLDHNDGSNWNYEDSSLADVVYSLAVKGRINAYKNPEVKEAIDTISRFDPVDGKMVVEYVKKWSIMDPAKFLSEQFSVNDLKYMTQDKIDTFVELMPDGEEQTNVRYSEFSFRNYTEYDVLESWELNTKSGITEISYKGVAPTRLQLDVGRDISMPQFWVNYSDVKDKFGRHKEYDVQNSLEWNLWTDRFRQKKR